MTSERLIRGLIDGDDEIYREFWDVYGVRLRHLASRNLPNPIMRRADPDDVVQSVCRTFFRRVQQGKLELSNSENLWSLLCAITLTKVQKQTRYHFRQKRGVNRERSIDDNVDIGAGIVDPEVPLGQSPSQIAAFAEQFRMIMESLDEQEQMLVQLKLEQCSEREIAKQLRCSTRIVRRILKRI